MSKTCVQVMDPSIKDVPVTEIGTFSEIAAACCQHDPLRRPRMREARCQPAPSLMSLGLATTPSHAARAIVALLLILMSSMSASLVREACT